MHNLNERQRKEQEVKSYYHHKIVSLEDMNDKELDEWYNFVQFMKRSNDDSNI